MTATYFDAIVIGGGHNGLTTANYLAMDGMRVCVLEQRPVVGGAAVTEEFHPGYTNSLASYVVSLLRQEVVDDLALQKYGYEPLLLENSLYLDSSGDYLLLNGDEAHDRAQFAKFSDTDYDAMLGFEHSIEIVGDLLAKQWLKEPPKLHGGGMADLMEAMKLGMDVYQLDADARWRLMQFFIGRRKASSIAGLKAPRSKPWWRHTSCPPITRLLPSPAPAWPCCTMQWARLLVARVPGVLSGAAWVRLPRPWRPQPGIRA